MTREQLQREVDFGAAMAIADTMLKRKLIDRKDYEFLRNSSSKNTRHWWLEPRKIQLL